MKITLCIIIPAFIGPGCVLALVSHSTTTNILSSRRKQDTPTHQNEASSTFDSAAKILPKVVLPRSLASVSLALSLLGLTSSAQPAFALPQPNDPQEGLSVVTQSQLGQSVRRSIVGGAKLADQWDLQWERLSDSRRDSQTCDPVTNRRRFDNGVRKDGTPIGNPVLGALCTPEPLLALDVDTTRTILNLANDAAVESLSIKKGDLLVKEQQVQKLVGPSFSRASSSTAELGEQAILRQEFNRDLYAQMRAYGEVIMVSQSSKVPSSAVALERKWGERMLQVFSTPQANRDDFKSPFPKPDPTEDQPYNEGALLDALGGMSVALDTLQAKGVIGHWEISIPEDDYWNVVTIAIDDDITMGGEIIAKERRQPLQGSPVVAMVRAAMESQAHISYKMTTYFIDPTTTKQELYNPTQLLISLNDLGQ